MTKKISLFERMNIKRTIKEETAKYRYYLELKVKAKLNNDEEAARAYGVLSERHLDEACKLGLKLKHNK